MPMNSIKKVRFIVTLSTLLFLYSCATPGYQYPPVTIEEITRLSQENVPSEKIIDKIKRTKTAYRLSADEIVEMKNSGVDSEVIDYMLKTYEDAIRREQELQDWTKWYYHYGHFYWSPYFYYYHRPWTPYWVPPSLPPPRH